MNLRLGYSQLNLAARMGVVFAIAITISAMTIQETFAQRGRGGGGRGGGASRASSANRSPSMSRQSTPRSASAVRQSTIQSSTQSRRRQLMATPQQTPAKQVRLRLNDRVISPNEPIRDQVPVTVEARTVNLPPTTDRVEYQIAAISRRFEFPIEAKRVPAWQTDEAKTEANGNNNEVITPTTSVTH